GFGFSGGGTGVFRFGGEGELPRKEKKMAAAGPLAVTFQRAFDLCANPLNTLNNLAELGIARVLTSGQKSDALQGLSKIMELIAHRDAPIIMAGAGVRAENLHHFLDAGVLEVHSSAGAWQASPMCYRNQGLSMSSDEHADEYSRYIVDGAAVAEMKGIIERHQAK
ncbi:copper homeostasis protein CutC, partial [Escherichia coli]|nr:copper homeostasis protein CutC [Escherichia coli]